MRCVQVDNADHLYLAGESDLTAVLAGVVPRLVLPAGSALRRTADPHTLDVPELDIRPALGTAHLR